MAKVLEPCPTHCCPAHCHSFRHGLVKPKRGSRTITARNQPAEGEKSTPEPQDKLPASSLPKLFGNSMMSLLQLLPLQRSSTPRDQQGNATTRQSALHRDPLDKACVDTSGKGPSWRTAPAPSRRLGGKGARVAFRSEALLRAPWFYPCPSPHRPVPPPPLQQTSNTPKG